MTGDKRKSHLNSVQKAMKGKSKIRSETRLFYSFLRVIYKYERTKHIYREVQQNAIYADFNMAKP